MGLRLSSGPQGITRVQSHTATTGATNAASLTNTLSAGPTKGNTIVVAYTDSGATATQMPFIAVSAGITWQSYAKINTNGVSVLLVVGYVAASGAGAGITVSTANAASRPCAMVAVEYSGLNIRPDRVNDASGNSTTPTTATLGTINFNNELVIGAMGCVGQYATTGTNPFSSPSAGSIAGQITTNNNTAGNDRACALIEYFTTTTLGNSQTAITATITSNQWAAAGMTFNECPLAPPNAFIG